MAAPWPHRAYRAQYFFLLFATAAPAYAQQPRPSGSEIVVIGQRGLVGIQADRIITEDEVSTYGLSSIDELLDEIAIERGSGSEETVYLIDGQRVMGLGDIGTYPTEAIDRIEVLPRGAAAQLGGSPSQQAVNILLKPKIRSFVGRASTALATDGGFAGQIGDISLTNITRPRRINLALRWRQNDALLESERNIIQTPEAPSDLGSFRSLRPEVADVELRGSVADQLAPNLNGFVTARLFHSNTRVFLGRGSNGNRLDQRSKLKSGNVDLQLNGELGAWLLAFNGAYGENRRHTLTDVVLNLGTQSGSVAETRARVGSASTEVNATGAILNLPAGTVSLTLRGRISRTSIESGLKNFKQWNREVGVGIQIPLSGAASRFNVLGDLAAGIEWSHGRTSRVGGLTNANYSLQWQPVTWLRLAGSVATGRTPPSLELTSGPILATPGVRYLDPLQGDTIDVVTLTGGNPALSAQRGTSRRLSLELRPSGSVPFVFTADYSKSRNQDIITTLPPGNNLLLLAFPERFVRDSNGRLISVDTRPLNFARQSEEQIRYGLELNVPLAGDDGRVANPADPARKSAASGTGRLRFNLSHTILIKSEVLVSSRFEPLDLLSRDAFGFGSGERPRHEVDFGVEYASRGLGVQLSGQYKGQSFLNLTGGTAPNILRFAPLTTFSIRAFVEGQRLLPSAFWVKGTRLSLQVSNIGNERQNVRDTNGFTPLFYQAAYRDPTGRLAKFELRKVF